MIRPQAIALHRRVDASSSPRNTWAATVTEIDRLGDRARVGVAGALTVTAEITVGALEALALRPGDEVWLAVKATDIDIYSA